MFVRSACSFFSTPFPVPHDFDRDASVLGPLSLTRAAGIAAKDWKPPRTDHALGAVPSCEGERQGRPGSHALFDESLGELWLVR